MSKKYLVLPLFFAGALMVGCEDKDASRKPSKAPDSATESKTQDAKSAADKAAAESKSAMDKAATESKAAADKAAIESKAAADKAANQTKSAADKAADTMNMQGTQSLNDLQTAVREKKWTDADTLIKKIDGMRDKLSPEQQTMFDTLKNTYEMNKNKP